MEEPKARKSRLVPARGLAALAAPKPQPVVKIGNERELLLMARELSVRAGADPQFSVMLLANPVLALKAYGFELTPALQDHVLRSLRHPAPLRQRRAELEAALEKALGEPARPNDPAWLAKLVFETRKLRPRETGGLQPAFGPELFDKAIRQMQLRRPAPTSRYPSARLLKGGQRLAVQPAKAGIRRLDMAAPLPDMRSAQSPLPTLTLEQAWFYKDDPIIAQAVELGQIMRRALPFRTPEEFRRLQAGEATDVFRAFVTRVTIKGGK